LFDHNLNSPEVNVSLFKGVVYEFIWTTVLASAVLHTGTKQDGNSFFGIAIGGTLVTGAIMLG